jgi:glycosyltransferase involved in cell wall biosynthesis
MWASVRRRFRRLAAQFSPDCIVSYWTYPDGAVAVRAARLLGVPVAVMVGGSDVLTLTGHVGRRRRIANVLHAADAVVTVGDDLKQKLIELGIDRGKIHIVPRGIDDTVFTPGDQAEARRRLNLPPHRKTLLWIGRMEYVKGLRVLLEACHRLEGRNLDYHVYLVGDGSLRQTLESICQTRGLCDRITFVGPVLQEGLVDWYRAADYMVLPSRSEGVPNVLREALACGTPFVASRVGGIPELAEGDAHRLVPPADPGALAEALNEVISAPAKPAGSLYRSPSWAESAQALSLVLSPLVNRSSDAIPL